jgi:hypothetical protein
MNNEIPEAKSPETKETSVEQKITAATKSDAKKLRMLVHPDKLDSKGEYIPPNSNANEPGSVKYHVNQQISILNSILDESKELDGDELTDDWEKVYRDSGKLYYLVRPTENGPELSPETISLPEYPEQFIRALHAYIDGQTWTEVKAVLNSYPQNDVSRRERSAPPNEEFFDEFVSATNLDDLLAVRGALIQKHPDKQSVIDARSSQRAAQLCKLLIQTIHTLPEAVKVKSVMRDFFSRPEARTLLVAESEDTIDSWVINFITDKMTGAKTFTELQDLMTQIREYEFAMDEFQRVPLMEKLGDRARETAVEQLRGRKAIESLDNLGLEVERFAFPGDEQSIVEFRAQMADWIRRKKDIIAYRQQIGWK